MSPTSETQERPCRVLDRVEAQMAAALVQGESADDMAFELIAGRYEGLSEWRDWLETLVESGAARVGKGREGPTVSKSAAADPTRSEA